MSDPRLCSVHLEGHPRRQEYRQARDAVVGACGQQTLAFDQGHLDQLEELRTQAGEGVAPAAPARFSLIDQDGLHNLKVGINTIGRLPDNDIPVADGSVSRRHCTIVVHASRGCEVFDTASKNGTFVNGQRIKGMTVLKAGDQIRLCDRQFVFIAARPGDEGDALTHADN
jgi:pSer/pThr/pTyr-binding forkhead associated (FHA) protein